MHAMPMTMFQFCIYYYIGHSIGDNFSVIKILVKCDKLMTLCHWVAQYESPTFEMYHVVYVLSQVKVQIVYICGDAEDMTACNFNSNVIHKWSHDSHVKHFIPLLFFTYL